jgi:hypothetical protein
MAGEQEVNGVVNVLSGKVIEVNFEHPSNDWFPMDVTESGIVRVPASLEQFEKAACPMDSTLLPRVRLVSPEQKANALVPISVTLLPTTTAVMLEQFLNA